MSTTKLNIGLTLSRNFQNVKLEFSDEVIEYDTDEELRAKIRKKFGIIKDEIEVEFSKI